MIIQELDSDSLTLFLVQGNLKTYTVACIRGRWSCTCWDYLMRHRECKHIKEVKNGTEFLERNK